jgi:NAD(P)H-flavin reductase/ferredoxin
MPVIHYNNKCYSASSDETLLDALLKKGVDFPHSCKIGTCQSCLTKLLDGEVLPEAQMNLKPTLIARDYFLACQCKPKSDMTIELPDKDDTAIASKIIELSSLSHNILRVKVAIDNPTDFRAGQYINLITPENIIRSYSIANVPVQNIELHIKLMPSGSMSHWLSKQASVGSSVYFRGPMGDCFYYNPEKSSFPIVLAGTGTGLAPLIGIANDALKNKHNGKIILIHGGMNEADLYLNETLNQLQETYPSFDYAPCVLNGSNTIRRASIEDVLLEKLKGIMNDVRLFICGPEETTTKLKKTAFLAGVPSASIYSDSFITAKP